MWFSNPVRGDVQEQKKVFASACVNELLDLCARENLSSTTAFFGTGQHIKVLICAQDMLVTLSLDSVTVF